MSKKLKQVVLAGMVMLAGGNAYAMNAAHIEHSHGSETVMIDYQYMRMTMKGLRDGTRDVSASDAISRYGYQMAPTSMSMDMHMIMPMVNITPQFSVMLMGMYIVHSMEMDMDAGNGDHTHGMNMESSMSMETSGFGDTQISAGYKIMEDTLAVNFGLSIPTADLDSEMPMHNATYPAPYGMQLGSGTYDLVPSLTYMSAYYQLRYGAQLSYTYHLDRNDLGYALGDRAQLAAWVRHPVGIVMLGAKLGYARWGDIEGKNKLFTNTELDLSPEYRTENYGGSQIDLGMEAKVPLGSVTVGANFSIPLYQNLNGLQMKASWSTGLSVSSMF